MSVAARSSSRASDQRRCSNSSWAFSTRRSASSHSVIHRSVGCHRRHHVIAAKEGPTGLLNTGVGGIARGGTAGRAGGGGGGGAHFFVGGDTRNVAAARSIPPTGVEARRP